MQPNAYVPDLAIQCVSNETGIQQQRSAAAALTPAFCHPTIASDVPVLLKVSDSDNHWRHVTLKMIEAGVIEDCDCPDGENTSAGTAISLAMQRHGQGESMLLSLYCPLARNINDLYWADDDPGEIIENLSTRQNMTDYLLLVFAASDDKMNRLCIGDKLEQIYQVEPELAESIVRVLDILSDPYMPFHTPNTLFEYVKVNKWEEEDDESFVVEAYGINPEDIVCRADFNCLPEWALAAEKRLTAEEIVSIGKREPTLSEISETIVHLMSLMDDNDVMQLYGSSCSPPPTNALIWRSNDVTERVADDIAGDFYDGSHYTDFYSFLLLDLDRLDSSWPKIKKSFELLKTLNQLLTQLVEPIGENDHGT